MSFFSLAIVALSMSGVVAFHPRPGPGNPLPPDIKDCRFIPGDRQYPTDREWNALNTTIGGRLIRGVPVGQVCYGPSANATKCSDLQNTWGVVNHLYVAITTSLAY